MIGPVAIPKATRLVARGNVQDELCSNPQVLELHRSGAPTRTRPAKSMKWPRIRAKTRFLRLGGFVPICNYIILSELSRSTGTKFLWILDRFWAAAIATLIHLF